MAKTEAFAAELEELGAREDLDEALRAKLRRTLDAAVRVLEDRIRADKRAHLRSISGTKE